METETMPRFSGTCRVLVVDVDGTFLNSAKAVTPAVRAALLSARDAGVHVCFATGRMFEAVAHWVDDLGLRAPQIANNGADVVDPRSGQRLLKRCLSPATVRWLLDRGEQLGFVPVLFSAQRVLAQALSADAQLIERNNEFVRVVPVAELYSLTLEVEKVLYLSILRAREFSALRDQLSEEVAACPGVQFSALITEPGILNFSDPAATKLQAVTWVCAHLGCRLDDVIAVGDGDNDADVLAGVGLGVAMGNASPAAQAAAARAVPDNDHDGLAVAVRELVLPAAYQPLVRHRRAVTPSAR
jgi:Cof subfamily protein (haloacid dehalogenase superfamily)